MNVRLTEAELDAAIRDRRTPAPERWRHWGALDELDALDMLDEADRPRPALAPLEQRLVDGAIGFALALVVVALLA